MATMGAAQINLDDFRSPHSRVYAGRDRGIAVRERVRLSDLERSSDVIEVSVPEDIFSVNSSFFLGMFGDSIRALGEEQFRKRYRFTGADIDATIDYCIAEALKRGHAL